MAEEDIQEAPEQKIEVETELFKDFSEKKVFKGSSALPGDGSLLALKIVSQVIDDSIIVIATDNDDYLVTNKPMLKINNAAAAAAGISQALPDKHIICFSDSKYTAAYFSSVLAAAERNDNVTFVCNNSDWGPTKSSFARHLKGNYVATSSVGFPEDLIRKLKKSAVKKGFKFIDVLCPDPKKWMFDPSNTIYVAKLASQTKLWPIYEVENKKVKITKRSDFEPVEIFFKIQKRLEKHSCDLELLQKDVDKSWKLLNSGILI
ncbi:hypothetical protein ACFLQN_00090 [Candidatus Aenigmatarchaeota archaeon]